MARTKKDPNAPTIIKKYANRRLYDTGQSCYVTLDDLCGLVKEGHDFVVQDAKSGEDITHSVLTQIIVEQEGSSPTLLSTAFLRKLIGFYGENVQTLVPEYLSQTIEFFEKNQEQIAKNMETPMENMGKMGDVFSPSPLMQEIGRQNMAMFENAMKMFTPFGMPGTYTSASSSSNPASSSVSKEDIERKIKELQSELQKMA